MKKTISILMLIIIMCFCWSCDSSTKSVSGDLIGFWHLINNEMVMKITTNSNQNIIDMNSEGTGSINLTGDINASLTYLNFMDYDGYKSITASNSSLMNMTYPKYNLNITPSEYYSSYQLTIQEDETSYTMYQTDTVDYSFDENTYTLIINSSNFYKLDMSTYQIDSSSVITVSGTLQNTGINILANTPTEIDMGFNEDGDSETTITIEKDGSWSTTTNDGYDGMTETTTGTWEIVDGKLVIIESYAEGGITVIDTMEFEYEIKDKNLIIKFEEVWCGSDEEESQEQCYENTELMLGLENGSLINVTAFMTMTLSTNPPVFKTVTNQNSKYILDSKIYKIKKPRLFPFNK